MKTAEQIENAIVKLKADLEEINRKIDMAIDMSLAEGVYHDRESIKADSKILDVLLKKQWQAEYRIKAYEYVLEKPKEEC